MSQQWAECARRLSHSSPFITYECVNVLLRSHHPPTKIRHPPRQFSLWITTSLGKTSMQMCGRVLRSSPVSPKKRQRYANPFRWPIIDDREEKIEPGSTEMGRFTLSQLTTCMLLRHWSSDRHLYFSVTGQSHIMLGKATGPRLPFKLPRLEAWPRGLASISCTAHVAIVYTFLAG